MFEFEVNTRTRVVFGVGKFEQLGKEASRIGKKAMIVGLKDMVELGVLAKARELLVSAGLKTVVFDSAQPEPRTTIIDEGARICRGERADLLVAIGGGSAIDTAKGIALGGLTGKPIWNYVVGGADFPKEPHERSLPVVAVPTVASSGSEFGAAAVLINPATNEKSFVAGDHLFPVLSILDPQLTVTAPRGITGDGGLDIISHAMDNYISNSATAALQDRFCESVMQVVLRYLPDALRDGSDLEARCQLLWTAALANAWVVHSGQNGGGPVHFIEHCLGGYYPIGHGRGMGILMPVLWEYNCQERPEKFAQMAENVFRIDGAGLSTAELGRRGIEAFTSWLKANGLYYRLRNVNIDDRHFENVAKDAVRVYESIGGAGGSLLNSRRLGVTEIVEVLRRAL